MGLKEKELKQKIENNDAKSERLEKQVGTNCEGFLVNFIKNGKRIRYFMKKTFVVGLVLEDVKGDYCILKNYFKNIIPNTTFIETKFGEVFSFSEPVVIDFDILEEKNREFLLKLLKSSDFSEKLLKQLKFFIQKFDELKNSGRILDLYGKENLVFTKDGRLKYIDNYEVFGKTDLVISESLKKIEYLKQIIKEAR